MPDISAVIFDVGNVLYDWDPRFLYERLIDDEQALEAFLRDVVTIEWHLQHDAGRPFAETSAELAARYPEHAELIRAWGPRFNDSIGNRIGGMEQLMVDLSGADVPLFAITNFSHEFWPSFHEKEADMFHYFRDVLVSGQVGLIKPDPAIYRLALDRFGIAAPCALFVDDRADNVEGAEAVGMRGHVFRDAPTLRRELIALGVLSEL
ncbi:HAD family hydrolase [Rhizorhapis suberifaciens]|uniref:2-haloacid dehalogenase n=1 Tax=Rhizorhapis suberifaciens TaxID=13656 RepID=A0A840HVA9_9SPHN|nr:HAD family phosphatase [Rhizorhapis suberifaciens]MBB4641384.1 2-haloacid dehalogenase [Rhizorhapis suberifaciens]